MSAISIILIGAPTMGVLLSTAVIRIVLSTSAGRWPIGRLDDVRGF